MELLGVRALARELGVSPGAVSRAVKEGRLTPAEIQRGGPKFDLKSARAEWKPNAPPSISDDCGDEGGGDDNARYRKARADKEEAIAAQEKLKLAQLQKELLPASEILIGWTQLIRAYSQALSGVPQKTFSRFPGLSAKGRDFLTDQLRLALADLDVWKP